MVKVCAAQWRNEGKGKRRDDEKERRGCLSV